MFDEYTDMDDISYSTSILICKYYEEDVLPLLYITGLRGGYLITENGWIGAIFGGSDFIWYSMYSISGNEVIPEAEYEDTSDKYGDDIDTRPVYRGKDNGFKEEKTSEDDFEKWLNDLNPREIKLKRIKREQ